MIELLFSGSLEDGGSLQWQGAGVLSGVIVLLLIIIMALSIFRYGQMKRLEVALMLPAVIALALAVLKPVWVVEGGHLEEPLSLVIVDNSRSMSVLEDGVPRSSAVERLLDVLEPDEIVLFGSDARSGSDFDFSDGASDLSAAFELVRNQFAGESLASISVVTDGLDSSYLRGEFRASGEIGDLGLPGPTSFYQVGTEGEVVDLSIAQMSAGAFAFLRTPFEIAAEVEGANFAGREVDVTLSRNGGIVSVRSITLDEVGRGNVVFSVNPTEIGTSSYSIEVPVLDEDAVPSNNTMSRAVRVVRDKLRVLQVCGSPSLDEKFLRLLLKQDPSVDLVSFFILRTYEDMGTGYNNNELSLIEFPYEMLFSTDLWSFDLVVLQNFNYRPYFGYRSNELLQNIADYVRQGGAMVMIGGDRSFDLGEYAGTPIESILPVGLGVSGPQVSLDSFRATLTPEGRQHSITRLLSEPSESEALWERLSELDGINLTTGASPGSAVLLRHPTVVVGGENAPVLAVREVGQGRTMALMGDSSWRWVMAEAAMGHGNQAYQRLWKNSMRWLVRDPVGDPVSLSVAQENYLLGGEVGVSVRVRDVGFTPIEGAEVSVVVNRATIGKPSDIESEDRVLITDSQGEASTLFQPEDTGVYRVSATATLEGQSLGGSTTVFAVTARDPELEEVSPDRDYLVSMAAAGGGEYFPPMDYRAPPSDEEAGHWVDETTSTPLWSGAWLPLIFGLFAGGSWWRRRVGGGR